jgi:serine/threonine protein kinase
LFNELLHDVLKEYAINYMMSVLEIGPKVLRKFGFDILVYEDCIEYCMEYCQTNKVFEQGKTDLDLKTALLTMHQINLVHLDIKPDNIAYSPHFKKWVFLDFGFSEFIEEKLGEKTFLCYVGTYEYSSPEMKKALTSDNYVDLYFNDVYALEKSFSFMHRFEDVAVSSNNQSSVCYNHTMSILMSA